MKKLYLAPLLLAIMGFHWATCPERATADGAEVIPKLHQITNEKANIAPTVATDRSGPIPVFGDPRTDGKHPNTLWDDDDIAHYKEMLKTSTELQIQFSELKARMDERITKPIDVPQPQQGPDGGWLYPGEYFPPFQGRLSAMILKQDSDDISLETQRLFLILGWSTL